MRAVTGFVTVGAGHQTYVIWIVLVLLLVALVGVGTVLEAAFWLLAIVAALVIASFVLLSRVVR